jgi:hypothetical protein
MTHTLQETKKFRGLIHIHTTYSYDGTLSIPEIVHEVKNRHFDFIFLTEHAEDFDDKKMHAFVQDCIKESDESFLIIPGLEFNINNEVHILGIGIENTISERDPDELVRKIHENNGIAILAHIVAYKNIPYTPLKEVDLIEIWNPRYSEILAPSIKSLKILQRFRKMNTEYFASGGLDLHNLEDLVPLYMEVYSARLTRKDILESLKRGDFTTIKGLIEITPLKDPAITMTGLIYLFALVQFIPALSKKIIRKISKIVKS